MRSLILVSSLIFGLNVHAQEIGQPKDLIQALLDHSAGQLAQPDMEAADVRTLVARNVGPTLKTHSSNVADCARGLTHLRLKVTKADLEVKNGGAKFSDGSDKTGNLNTTFDAGYTSPWVSVNMLGIGNRCVKSVFVVARAADGRSTSRAVVEGRFK